MNNDKRLTGAQRDISPCCGCTERFTACHDSCDRYKNWKAEAERIKAVRKSYLQEQNMIFEEEKRRSKWQRTITKHD